MPIRFVYSLQGMLAHKGETYDLIDKSSWPEGEWTKEPDAVVFQHRGLWCAVARTPTYGALVGYVRVPQGHPWNRVTYQGFWELGGAPSVHGGLTYTEPGEDEDKAAWYLGFDCAHDGDHTPNPVLSFLNGTYRNIGYVYEEVLGLARQAEKAEPLPVQLNPSLN